MNPINTINPEFTMPDPSQTSNLEEQFPEHTAKAELRNQISVQAGDIESQHGTTADISQMLCYGFLLFMQSLHDAKSLNELRAVAEPFTEIAEDFFAKIETGKTQLPFIQKGMGKVVDDMAKRATAAAEALEAKKKAPMQNRPLERPVQRPVQIKPVEAETQVEAKDILSAKSSAKWQVASEAEKVPAETEEPEESKEPKEVQNVNSQQVNQHIARIMGNHTQSEWVLGEAQLERKPVSL